MTGDGAPDLDSRLAPVLGGRTASRLARADLHTVGDLLRHYPRRYTQRGTLTDLASIRIGEAATLWARVTAVDNRALHRGRGGRGPKWLTRVTISDGHRRLPLSFFNQPWLATQLTPGTEVLVSGTVSEFRGKPQMSSPEIATTDGSLGDVADTLEVVEAFAGGIIPVYPLTEGLTSALLQRCLAQVLAVVGGIPDPLPAALRAERDLIDLDAALRHIHRPPSRELLTAAIDRLTYDEALAVQLVLARNRVEQRRHPAEPCPPVAGGLLDAFDAALPFTLTAGQQQVGREIAHDLSTIHPMNRLLQGEVGSGKTVVALRAMLQVIDSGRQAVMLAPTEVLAAQHVRSLRDVLGPLGRGGELGAPPEAIAVTLLTGSTSTAARRAALLDLASGQPGIVVGTHALLSDDVILSNVGLVVIDEQHRFGVEQRDRLRTSGGTDNPPHLLVMTATPIPRTVAMTAYGDLDTSTLRQLPSGRADVSTTVVPTDRPGWLERVWQRAAEEVAAGHQVYVVCPKIGGDVSGDEPVADPHDVVPAGAAATDAAGSDGAGSEGAARQRPPQAVLEVADRLRSGPLAGVHLGHLHGRMAPADKDAVMRAFAAGRIDVLVATTVIEVGVDVANASMMVVLDAERFGMSQLHQLRGRIGRGAVPGVCLLVTDAAAGSLGRQRLEAVAASRDGFDLAEADLRLRREGDVLGVSQSGRRSSLRLLSLLDDREVIERARHDAIALVDADPQLAAFPGLAALTAALIDPVEQDFLHKS